jgi:hypothetical protein
MRTVLLAGLVSVVLGGVCAWSARAGDGTSVEERLASVERRVAALESKLEQIPVELAKAAPAALPNLLAARLSANETAAIATLRNIVTAQAQFQASAKADEDQDGNGEYGGFLELSGGAAGRMIAPLVPPVLSGAFRVLGENGTVTRSGYCFRIFLPGPGGAGVGEPPTGYAKGGGVDAESAEVAWCCYAWPIEPGVSGKRSFFTSQEGDVLATEAAAYAGTGHGPAADAAFHSRGKVTGRVAVEAKGSDGNVWRPVN